jgi:hypothetical protein
VDLGGFPLIGISMGSWGLGVDGARCRGSPSGLVVSHVASSHFISSHVVASRLVLSPFSASWRPVTSLLAFSLLILSRSILISTCNAG